MKRRMTSDFYQLGSKGPQRLQKILAAAGVASRRRCEELIEEGRVAVNGRVAKLGDKADPERDEITLDGLPVPTSVEKVYLLVNKPKGYITSVSDPQGRPTVLDLIDEETKANYRVFPVGRLDKDTQGLLLLTNDGELANRLTHPSCAVPKTYVAIVSGALIPGAISKLSKGVKLEDGMTLPAKVKDLGEEQGRRVLQITISEGRKRQVRRMIKAVGGKVEELVRTRIGPLELEGVESGAYRRLEPWEVHELYRASRARGVGSGRNRAGSGSNTAGSGRNRAGEEGPSDIARRGGVASSTKAAESV